MKLIANQIKQNCYFTLVTCNVEELFMYAVFIDIHYKFITIISLLEFAKQ